MHALLTLEEMTSTPIGEGDAGVILKKDGSFQVFNTYKTFDPENITDRQREQVEAVMAFSVALKFPAIMQILVQMSQDPDIVKNLKDFGIPN